MVKADVAALVAEQERVNRRLAELTHIFSFLGSTTAIRSPPGTASTRMRLTAP